MRLLNWLFGAWGQISVGVLLVVITAVQAVWWGIAGPTTAAVYWVSIEALFFAAYAVIATGITLLATQRVMAIVDPDDPTPGPGD